MFKQWISIAAAMMLGSIAFNAQANTLACNNCTTAQLLAKATAGPTGVTYVYNVSGSVVKKYLVTRECESGTCVKEADGPYAAETAVQNYINFLHAHPSSQVALGVGSSLPQNGYDLVGFPQYATNVSNYLKNSGIGLISDLLTFLNAVNPITAFNPGAASMTLRVMMTDGSSALFVYDHTTQTWVRVKGQTKDSSGNIVPETAADVSGGAGSTIYYNFANQNDLFDFIDRLNQLGVPITGGTGTGIVCVGQINGGGSNCAQTK